VNVTDELDNKAQCCKNVTVNPPLNLTCAVDPYPTTKVGHLTSFTGNVSGGVPPYDWVFTLDGEGLAWVYNTTGTWVKLSTTFDTAGNYTLCVNVTDYLGNKDQCCKEFTVNPALNLTCAVDPNPTKVGHVTNFTAEASGGVGNYTWLWTVDGTPVATTQNTTYTFGTAGNYTVCVNVTDSLGNEEQCCKEVTVNPHLTMVSCAVSPNPTRVYHAINVTAEVSGGVTPYTYVCTIDGIQIGYIPNVNATSIKWGFIDLDALGSAGNYTICVNVTDSLDNKAQCCKEFTVYRAGINVDKTASPTSGVVSTDVTFTITVTNTNGCILNPVIVVDTLPNGMSYVSDNSSGVQSPTGTITWNLSSMDSGESVTIELVARIDSGASGTLTNVVNATGTPPEGEDVIDSDSANVVVIVPPPPVSGGSCPDTKYLTVDWEGNNTTEPLYSNDKLAVDLLGPSPDSSDNLFLERGTQAPVVGERTYYLIIVRELEDIPPLPENYQAIVVINVTPADAEFNRDIFLTLGLNQTELPANILNLTMVYYDDVNEVWETLDYEAGGPNGVAELTLSAPINHFSIYAVLAEVAPPPPPAHFVPSGLSIVPSVEKTIFVTKTGETVTITANVANDGGQSGTYTAVLKLNGETVDTKTVTLGAGQSQQVSFTQSGLDYGQYEVEVAGLTDTFTVSRTITWWLIILIIVAIGLIIWGVVWGRRRRRKAQQEV